MERCEYHKPRGLSTLNWNRVLLSVLEQSKLTCRNIVDDSVDGQTTLFDSLHNSPVLLDGLDRLQDIKLSEPIGHCVGTVKLLQFCHMLPPQLSEWCEPCVQTITQIIVAQTSVGTTALCMAAYNNFLHLH